MEVYDIIKNIYENGEVSAPRGLEIKELVYFQETINNPWSNYAARNYPLDYYKYEMQWYLHADPLDHRICDHAKIWEKIIQKDGSIFSNYGQYWFGHQLGYDKCLSILRNDPNSRQAYLPMCNYHHVFEGNRDVVCTKGIQFRIIKGKLWMHVSMRSSDAIWGLATDLPCFHTLMTMMARELGIPMGEFVFSSDSVHIYERHYKMVEEILDGGRHQALINVPVIDDVDDLITETYCSEFGRWLTEVKL